MAGWLTKAAGAFRGEQPEQPAPFEVVCECGLHHNGVRRRKPQRIICRACGSALFVLPRDSYPPPQAPLPRQKKRRRKSGDDDAESDAAAPRFQQVATNVFQASEKVGRSAATVGIGLGQRLRTWAQAFLALWTPLRLMMLGGIAVCVATVAYVMLVDWSEQTVVELKAANEAARKALQERQIAAAHEHLTAAVAALDKLERRDDPLAREIRLLHRESTAIRDALPISPLQMVVEADTHQQTGAGDQWQETFRAQYRNRWMIIDGLVQRLTTGPERGQSTVSLPLRIGPTRRSIALNVAIADLDRLTKGKPRHAVFAVQLTGCELSSDRRTWKLQVNSQTAFLWGTMEDYEAAGFSFDSPEAREEIEQVLTAQRRVLGIADARSGAPTSPASKAPQAAEAPPAGGQP
ncbi:MAG: hypothetical protein U0992_20080 [Planctomycetaceae bacterium]